MLKNRSMKPTSYDGNRAVLFKSNDPVAPDELRQCITMALTYHQRA